MTNKEAIERAMTPKELAHMIYQPDKTDPDVTVKRATVVFDFVTFTRTVKWDGKGSCEFTDQAKRGQCLARSNPAPEPGKEHACIIIPGQKGASGGGSNGGSGIFGGGENGN